MCVCACVCVRERVCACVCVCVRENVLLLVPGGRSVFIQQTAGGRDEVQDS